MVAAGPTENRGGTMVVYEALKDVLKLAQKADNVEIQRALMEVQQAALDLQAENQTLRDRVRELEGALAFSGELEFKGGFYVRKGSDPPERFCPGCWDGKHRASRITRHVSGRPHCAVCGTVYSFR
jgi:hypothetical protein